MLRELVIASLGRDGMYDPGHALVAVVCLPGPRGEDPVLQKEWLIPGKALFEKMSLPGLILSMKTILV